VTGMVALLLVAASLGWSNLAASVGIGVSGVDGRTRLRVGLVFGAFETAMPVIGLLLGRGLASALGPAAHWTGAGLLIATGQRHYVTGRAGTRPPARRPRRRPGRNHRRPRPDRGERGHRRRDPLNPADLGSLPGQVRG